jgi:arylsulfatase A-like enzyme
MLKYFKLIFLFLVNLLLCYTVTAQELVGTKETGKTNFIIILTDDQGWSDFSPNKMGGNLKTPHLDQLVRSGVNLTNAYTSAPQCIPARVGLLLGKAQNRIGIERNGDSLKPFTSEQNIAELLSENGYTCAMIGKWHLGDSKEITSHGFRFVYNQVSKAPFWANFTKTGRLKSLKKIQTSTYHIDSCSETALSFIRQHQQEPFFLFLSLRAPHVPLDAPEKYLSRFPNELPKARRQALGMLAAIDDGIGLITNELSRLDLTKRTCIFYLSDNGAPLKLEAKDASHPTLGWNGSYNAPLNGEKGMLTEGGIRIPFAVSWPDTIPPRKPYHHPVTTLDIVPTIVSQIGLDTLSLDGVNLLPYIQGLNDDPPHSFLCWRWIAQTAIRQGKWKYLQCEERKYLFNLEEDLSEKNNLIHKFPSVTNNLQRKLSSWSQKLKYPGLKNGELPEIWVDYFNYHLGRE